MYATQKYRIFLSLRQCTCVYACTNTVVFVTAVLRKVCNVHQFETEKLLIYYIYAYFCYVC